MANANELMLLERVFLRVGSADTDERLQSTLAKFLPPVLLKMSSSDEAVRKKVMELLIHINKRVKSRPQVQLPIDVLLRQYQDPQASIFVTNFSILYIKLGYPRLDIEKKTSLASALINSMENKPHTQQDTILQLLMPVWGHIKVPSTPGQTHDIFGLSDKPKTTQLLLDFMLDLLILPYGVYVPRRDNSSPNTPAPPLTIPPGMSEVSLKRVVGESEITAEELEKAKLGVLHFLSSGILPEQRLVVHFVVAFSDSRHSVATAADYELKKMTRSIDWEDEKTMKSLYQLYLGTPKTKEKAMKAENIRSAVSTRVRLKLFPYLLKSRKAATLFPLNVQVTFEGLFGKTTNQKLKTMAVQFVYHLCLHCPKEKLAPVAQVLMNGMHDVIKNNTDDSKMKIAAYSAIGKLGHAVPSLVTGDIGLLQQLFDAISHEQADARLGIQEALAMLLDSYKNTAPSDRLLLEALLMQNIEKEDPLVRSLASNYAAAIFPPDHVPSRFLLLLASGDLKEDIQTSPRLAIRGPLGVEASTGDNMAANVEAVVPPFVAMVKYVTQQAQSRVKSNKKTMIRNHALPFNPVAYSEIVKYLRVCLAYSVGVRVDMDTFTPATPPPLHIDLLLSAMDSQESEAVESYLGLVKTLLKATEDYNALYCLLEMVAMCPDRLCEQFRAELPWIKNFVLSSKDERRIFGAQLYSLVYTYMNSLPDVLAGIEELVGQLSTQKTVDKQHGLLLAIGHMIGLLLRGQQDRPFTDQTQSVIAAAVRAIVGFLSTDSPTLQMGACSALGEIGRNGSLMLPPGGKDCSPEDGEITQYTIVTRLITAIKSSNTSDKVKERIATCLGYMCTGEANFPHRKDTIQGLMDLQTTQLELHLTVGAALVCAAEGWMSPARRNVWLQTEEEYREMMKGENDIGWYLQLILSQYISSDNPLLRQASCVWLLTLVKSCGHHVDIQANIMQIQTAFMHLLTEKQEVIQDIASKGLGVVYDQCSADQKSMLVSELVDTLMTGKRAKQQVDEGSELFQEGSLGKTPDGSSLSTYKELCSIASDLNQPDLIYKFMHLANHQAMWNSRKGAAFGFSTIVSQAGEQMAPYLPQIVPKLYRYQFDPNPKVQRAMSSIWSALVKDNKKTVELYKREILVDLVNNLTSAQWRVRESSCYAVSDVLSGRGGEEVVELLPELWTTCLRVRDDIKESVRKAAESACKTLSKVSIRVCDAESGSMGQRATSLVLPCLLNATIQSQVKEVRALGLSTLLEMSKKAGRLLRPNIPQLVTALLEAVSGLEPQILNYLSLHAGSSQQSQEQLDNVRIAASKSSPMMETVNRCVQYVDSEVLNDLVPRLCDLIKTGIGVATKVGCANFIVSLVRQCSMDLAPHAGKLITALMNGLLDRNPTIRNANATAIGNVVKVAKDSRVEKLIVTLQSWYISKEDERAREACCVCLWSISHHSPDVLKRHSAIAMPLAFFAMHETWAEAGTGGTEMSKWEEVWSEGTPGTESGLKLYLGEITSALSTALDSQSWQTKAQAAAAMSTLASKLSSSLTHPHLTDVLTALISGLSGRTWAGKESLLKALSTVCTSCKTSIEAIGAARDSQPDIHAVITAVLKECRKDKLDYKRAALICVGEVIETYGVDYFTPVWDILSPHLLKTASEGADEDVDEDMEKGKERMEYEECMYRVMGQAWPSTPTTQEMYRSRVCDLLTSSLASSSWKVQLEILKSLQKFITRSVTLNDVESFRKNLDENKTIVESITGSVTPTIGDLKYSAVRAQSLVVVETLLQAVTSMPGVSQFTCWQQLRAQLSPVIQDSRSELYDRAKVVVNLLGAP